MLNEILAGRIKADPKAMRAQERMRVIFRHSRFHAPQ